MPMQENTYTTKGHEFTQRLMAAEVIAQAGVPVDLYEAMPSVGRKFLVAGKGGLNLTHSEASEAFLGALMACARAVGTDPGRVWAESVAPAWLADLGFDTLRRPLGAGFPHDHAGRADAARLACTGCAPRRDFHVRHRWQGWGEDALRFATPPARHRRGAVRVGAGRRKLAAARVERDWVRNCWRSGRSTPRSAGQLRLRRRLERASFAARCRPAAENGGAEVYSCYGAVHSPAGRTGGD